MMLINQLISSPYFRANFERQEWVHEWARPTVQFFGATALAYSKNVPIAIMLEMQGGIDGYLLLDQCSISYKTRAAIPVEGDPQFWRNLASNSAWITPSLAMRQRLGDYLDVPNKILSGIDLGDHVPVNFHEFSLQLAKATSGEHTNYFIHPL
jgi:hypothetical protein